VPDGHAPNDAGGNAPVFSSRHLLRIFIPKPVTPFANTSPKAIPPEQTLLAFMNSIIDGERRLAHTDWLRGSCAARESGHDSRL
jgi:hypothetical protein